jgi:hypothetical protein
MLPAKERFGILPRLDVGVGLGLIWSAGQVWVKLW